MRCFLAIELSEEVRTRLKGLLKELSNLDVDVKPVKSEQMHLTFAFFGDLNEVEAQKKIDALKTVAASLKPFKLRVKGTGFFPSPKFVRVFFVKTDSDELAALQKKVLEALAQTGFKQDKPFKGHATIARVRSPKNLDALRSLQEKFAETDFGECLVDKLVFKKSTLTPKGPVYEDVAVISLSG